MSGIDREAEKVRRLQRAAMDEQAARGSTREAREAEIFELHGEGRLCARTVPGHEGPAS